jgi:hypothetical protein
MKFCVLVIFQLLPWLGWVGDWALSWTEGKAWMQITFVMLIFPLIMNAMQYYIIDSFIKDSSGTEYQAAPGEDIEEEENEGLIRGRRGSDDDENDSDIEARGEEPRRRSPSARTKEANPTPIPVDLISDGDESSSLGKSSLNAADDDKKK